MHASRLDTSPAGRSRYLALVVLCAGMLMIILDQTIVNVALPAIQRDLGFSQSSLAWVVNAYLIPFGGLLLLAGRLGDLLGRARAAGGRDDGRHGLHLRRRLRRICRCPTHQRYPVPLRPALGSPRRHPGDLANRVWFADHWAGPEGRRDPPDSRWHLSARPGRCCTGKDRGATVLATTRRADRIQTLSDHGVDCPLVDTGQISSDVRQILPGGVDAALELIGTPTLPDTLASTRVHRTVCFTGMLSNEWIVPNFYPIAYLPKGVRLTAYGGDSGYLPGDVLQRYLDKIASGQISLGPTNVYRFDDIRKAHADMEHNRAVGKLVVRIDPSSGA